MESLKQKILNEDRVKDGKILKVDNFLNHQLDIEFLNEIGKEFKSLFLFGSVTNHDIAEELTSAASARGYEPVGWTGPTCS